MPWKAPRGPRWSTQPVLHLRLLRLGLPRPHRGDPAGHRQGRPAARSGPRHRRGVRRRRHPPRHHLRPSGATASGHYDAEQLRAAHPEQVLGSLTEPFPGLPTRPHPATTHDATDTRRCVDPRSPSPAALVRTEGHRRGNSSRSAEHERGCSARRFPVGPRPGWYQRRAPIISLRYASSPGCRPRPATDRSGIGRGSPTRSATHRAEASGVVVSGSALPVCGAR